MSSCIQFKRVCRRKFGAFVILLIGTLSDGREVSAFLLKNAKEMSIQALDLGGVIASIKVPDSSGNFADITAGRLPATLFRRRWLHGRHIGKVCKPNFWRDILD